MICRKIIEAEKETLIENQLKHNPKASKEVLQFIMDFVHCNIKDMDDVDHVIDLFRAGYCYYFAAILKTAFNRGTICWAAPYGHLVWQDENGICYDIEGVNHTDVEEYIPIEYIGEAINDFKHVRGLEYNISEQEIAGIILKYQEDKKSLKKKPKKELLKQAKELILELGGNEADVDQITDEIKESGYTTIEEVKFHLKNYGYIEREAS